MSTRIRKSVGVPALFLAALTLAAPGAGTARDAEPSEAAHFEAFAVDRNPAGGAAAGRIEIVVERWSSEAEGEKLRTAMQKSSDDLLSTLQDLKRVGFIRAQGGGLGWNLQYARRIPLPDGGSRVVVATDRPMSFVERTQHPRSADYEFLVAELHVGRDGRGEGKLVPAARIHYDKGDNTIEIENYANEPVQLTKVVELKDDDETRDKASKDKATAPRP